MAGDREPAAAAQEIRAAFSIVLRNPTDECSMYRWLSLVDGDITGMCSGPVMYEARALGAPDWSLRYHLCVACAAEFRREGKHEIRDRKLMAKAVDDA